MHWVIQENIFREEAYDRMIETLERFDIPYSIHKVVPFVGELIPEPVIEDRRVMCFGSYSMRHVAKRMGWHPGVFDLESADFRVQREHWGEEMLNYDSIVVPFKGVVFTQEDMFVRPIHDSKHFAGRVFSRDEFVDWQTKVCKLGESDVSTLTPDTLVQVSVPKAIQQEARFWIVKGDIVASSIYKIGDRVQYMPVTDRDMIQYVSNLTSKSPMIIRNRETREGNWQPADAYCIDVCRTEDGFKIVEINTINSCGLYAAEITDLILALDRM